MRTDFENLPTYGTATFYPKPGNPSHRKPFRATIIKGNIYCIGTDYADGPDYSFFEAVDYCQGFEIAGGVGL